MSAPALTRDVVDLSGDGTYHVLTGPAGAITWTITPGRPVGTIAVHSPTPRWDGHHPDTTCPFLDGRPCYSDANTRPTPDGDLYAYLADWYEQRLGQPTTFVPVDLDGALRGRGQRRLRDIECRRALIAVSEGDTIYDAVRAQFAERVRTDVIAANLKFARMHADLTPAEVARRMTLATGIEWTITMVNRAEAGSSRQHAKRFSDAEVEALAVLFGRTVEWFLTPGPGGA